jgi:hypothetical protein
MVGRMRQQLVLLSAVFVLSACPKSAPPPELKVVVDAGTSEAELIAPKLDALEAEAAVVVRTVDEALWQHWTAGAPLDLSTVTKGHDALFTTGSLALLRRGRELRPADATRLDNLSHWLAGEVLARAVAPESEAIANLEATTTFTLDGKELSFRDLSKLLVSEKSAVKRHAMWTASLAAALRLDAAIARRDEKLKETLASLGFPGPLEFAAATRELDLDALGKEADGVLAATDETWKATLQSLSDAELKLPRTALTRGDLPRLLKVPAGLDAEFPKSKIASRALQTLGTLKVYGKPGLTLDLAEAAKKNPLPLTVAPTLGDVRVSVRPLGGLRDQQAVLAELGAALELARLTPGADKTRPASFAVDRLQNPVAALRASELFSTLLTEDAWLQDNDVNQREAVISSAKALHLFSLRRAAGIVLATLETRALTDDAEARAKFVGVMSRALGLTLSPEEGARWRLETDDFLRSATQLTAMQQAEQWKMKMGGAWWKAPPIAQP